MAEYLIQDTTLTSIADAIRTKGGKTGSIAVSNMATEIENLPSGGASLNFSVTAYSSTSKLPSSAAANAIGVITSTAIKGWVLSTVEPSSPTAGLVWIVLSAYGNVSFNALGENSIIMYPVHVRQYVSGKWVTKDARIYQSKWVNFVGVYIYNKGTSTSYSFRCNTSLKQTSGGYTATDGLTKGGTSITVTNGTLAYAFTDIFVTDGSDSFTAINLSNYSKVRIKGTLTNATKDTACVFRGVSSIGTLATDNNKFSYPMYSGTVDFTADISSVTSSCYLGFTFYDQNTTLTITEMWLE